MNADKPMTANGISLNDENKIVDFIRYETANKLERWQVIDGIHYCSIKNARLAARHCCPEVRRPSTQQLKLNVENIMKQATTYFNMKTAQGTETVEELNTKDFENYYTFNRELRRLTNEYALAGMNVYTSQRACKSWTNN